MYVFFAGGCGRGACEDIAEVCFNLERLLRIVTSVFGLGVKCLLALLSWGCGKTLR